MINEIFTLTDLPAIARKIINESKHKTVLFYAEMGCGKTTLIKEIIKQLGVNDTVSSPTFSLVNEYLSGSNEEIYHFDFYRMADENEALDIGIEEYLYKNAWCFIEWPQHIENLLPLESVSIHLEIINEHTRKIQLKNFHQE